MVGTVNKQQLAALQGISLPTITRWMAEGMPIAEKGGRGKTYSFDNAAVTTWRVNRARAEGGSKEAAVNESESKARKMAAEASLAEMKAAQLRSELCVQADLIEDIQNDFAKIRARILAVPVRCAPLVIVMNEQEARKSMNDLLCEALDELSSIPIEEFFEPFEARSGIPEEKFVGNAIHSGQFTVELTYDVEVASEQVSFETVFTAPPPVD